MNSKRAILYCRVSSDEQAKHGNGLDRQLPDCRQYADRNGFDVVATFLEDYTGAVPIEQRPEGKKAYSMLASNEADALIVHRMDRLVRPPEEGDEIEILILARSLAKLGKEIHTCNRGKIGTSVMEMIIALLDGKSAGDERRTMIERTSRGRYSAARKGKIVGHGQPPYGYRFQDERLVVYEPEAKIVRIMFSWYVAGDESGRKLTGHAIARRLSETQVPTPQPARKRTREITMWHGRTVLAILGNETYVGTWRYGKKMYSGGKQIGRKPLSEQVAVAVPAIIDHGVWIAAQEQRDYNKRMAQRHCQREYLLRGMVRCGHCGFVVTGDHCADRLYYRCSRHASRFAGLEERCPQKFIRTAILDTVVWNYILELWDDKDKFERQLKDAQRKQVDDNEPIRVELAHIADLRRDCETEAGETANALKKVKGGIVEQKLLADADRIQQQIVQLDKRAAELQARLGAQTLTDSSIRAALQYRSDVVLGLKNPTFEDKRQFLRLLKVSVRLRDKTAWIKCAVRVDEQEVSLADVSVIDGCDSCGGRRRRGTTRRRTRSGRCPPASVRWRPANQWQSAGRRPGLLCAGRPVQG
jgi:site-specific DNA recombinase